MHHERLVRKNRVFVLGAGFSAAAGVPLTDALLEEALRLFADECPGIYSRFECYARKALGSKSEILIAADLNRTPMQVYNELLQLAQMLGSVIH